MFIWITNREAGKLTLHKVLAKQLITGMEMPNFMTTTRIRIRYRRIWEDDFKKDLQEMGRRVGMDWIDLA
jgi:hypothetical protein